MRPQNKYTELILTIICELKEQVKPRILSIKSKKIKALRESKNVGLRELAEKAGVAITMIGKHERGETVPKGKSLVKLAEALDVSVNDLIGESLIKLTSKTVDPKKFQRSLQEAALLDEDTKTLLNVVIDEFVEKKKLKYFQTSLEELSKTLG